MPTALDEDPTDLDRDPHQVPRWKFYLQVIKIVLLLVLWSFCAYYLIAEPVTENDTSVVIAVPTETLVRTVRLGAEAVKVFMTGPINERMQRIPVKEENVPAVGVRVQWLDSVSNRTIEYTPLWNVYLKEDELDTFVMVSKVFNNPNWRSSKLDGLFSLESKCDFPVALRLETDPTPMYTDYGLLYCVLLVLGLFALMFFELTDPTLSVLLIATTGLAILAALGERPSLRLITYWVDLRILLIMLSFMVLSGIISETGVFEWLAIQIYRISKGHRWLTLFFMAIVTAVLSSVFPNVTIVSLMSPIAVLLCEVISAQTTLGISVVIWYSNIGGALTLVGDPINIYIATHTSVNHTDFAVNMFPGVLCGILVGLPVIYLTMRRNLHRLNDHQIKVMAKREETRPRRSSEVAEKEAWLRKNHPARPVIRPSPKYFESLAYLKIHYGIRDKLLLAKSLIVVLSVQIAFIMQLANSPNSPAGELYMMTLMGATLLVILTKLHDLEKVWNYLDWPVLLFLGAHFVFVAVVHRLGLTHWLGDKAVRVVSSVETDHQATVAILLIVWLTAFMASIVNNIAVTEVSLGLIKDLTENVNIPMSPLIWALSYGSSFGANGTLMGAHANLMGVVIARRFGYRITFLQFFRYGFPLMLASLTLASAYLLIAHFSPKFDRTSL